jgi:hypothetical protein
MSVEHKELENLRRLADQASSGHEIWAITNALAEELMHKNIAYGDSALAPMRVLAKSDLVEQILVRMDDKLNRLIKGDAGDEDVLFDFVGYWVLLQIAKQRQGAKRSTQDLAAPVPAPSPVSSWLPSPETAPSDEALAQAAAFVDKVNPPVAAVPDPGPAEEERVVRDEDADAAAPAQSQWESKYGPLCQNEGCENNTGNSERVVCPPCLQQRGFGSHMNGGPPNEGTSEGTLRRA